MMLMVRARGLKVHAHEFDSVRARGLKVCAHEFNSVSRALTVRERE